MAESDKEKGIYNKYYARRIDDASGKHEFCFLFVLDLDHDPFAESAIRAYIEACQGEYPLLAEDLNKTLLSVSEK